MKAFRKIKSLSIQYIFILVILDNCLYSSPIIFLGSPNIINQNPCQNSDGLSLQKCLVTKASLRHDVNDILSCFKIEPGRCLQEKVSAMYRSNFENKIKTLLITDHNITGQPFLTSFQDLIQKSYKGSRELRCLYQRLQTYSSFSKTEFQCKGDDSPLKNSAYRLEKKGQKTLTCDDIPTLFSLFIITQKLADCTGIKQDVLLGVIDKESSFIPMAIGNNQPHLNNKGVGLSMITSVAIAEVNDKIELISRQLPDGAKNDPFCQNLINQIKDSNVMKVETRDENNKLLSPNQFACNDEMRIFNPIVNLTYSALYLKRLEIQMKHQWKKKFKKEMYTQDPLQAQKLKWSILVGYLQGPSGGMNFLNKLQELQNSKKPNQSQWDFSIPDFYKTDSYPYTYLNRVENEFCPSS